MAGLKLKLGPDEQILINGVVVQNGNRQCQLTIKTPNANILRLRDAIHPSDANTPVSRACYVAQLAVAGEAEPDQACAELTQAIGQLAQVFTDPGSTQALEDALGFCRAHNFYQTLQHLRRVLKFEQALIARMALPVEPDNAPNRQSAAS